jgi:hypothetical protein
MQSTPNGLHDLRGITVKDLIVPAASTTEGIWPYGHLVNIFALDVGAANENGFPGDVAPFLTDVYSIVVAHEYNHVVDAARIESDPALRSRKQALIAQAGADPLNYLRSMLPEGFFVSNPQEFFASISNQWFANTDRTLALARARLAQGRKAPASQFIFFLDVYSQRTPVSFGYQLDTQGNLQVVPILVFRDTASRIRQFLFNRIVYLTTYGIDGFVSNIVPVCSYNTADPLPPCPN